MVNIVIIGCGSITEYRHAPECYASEKINLVGFYNTTYERAARLAEKYHCKAYESYEEVLNDPIVDAVIICTSNKSHCDMTVQAFEHKKHVLCEKPISVTLEEAEKMILAGKKAQKHFMIAHNQRFDATSQKIKEILSSNVLGKILSFYTTFKHGGPEGWSVEKSNKTWFFDKNKAGLGAMGDLGIHKADLIRWLIGEEIKYVSSVVTTLDKKDPEGNPIAMEDHAIAILQSENGITGTLEASWTAYGRGFNQTTICCEKGIVETVNDNQVALYYRNGTTEVFDLKQGTGSVAETFAECIENGTEPEISGEEGMKALKIILACIKSSKTNTRVEV